MLMEQLSNNINYIPLLIGWVLGILSSLIVEKLKKRSLKKEIKIGIITELKELQLNLSSICFSTTIESRKISEEWSIWI